MSEKITAPNPVLIGVSFGGILVQEMAAFLNPQKVIIISSVKSNLEFPRRMKIAKTTKAYKLIPTSIFSNIEKLSAFSFGKSIAQRLKLYERYLSVRDVHYLDWAIDRIVLWDRTQVDTSVIHIHGDADEVFPMQYIKDCIVVKGGTHVMILSKYKWLNENLPAIILGEFLEAKK
jgi:alpha/beta superfamily hydrolase